MTNFMGTDELDALGAEVFGDDDDDVVEFTPTPDPLVVACNAASAAVGTPTKAPPLVKATETEYTPGETAPATDAAGREILVAGFALDVAGEHIVALTDDFDLVCLSHDGASAAVLAAMGEETGCKDATQVWRQAMGALDPKVLVDSFEVLDVVAKRVIPVLIDDAIERVTNGEMPRIELAGSQVGYVSPRDSTVATVSRWAQRYGGVAAVRCAFDAAHAASWDEARHRFSAQGKNEEPTPNDIHFSFNETVLSNYVATSTYQVHAGGVSRLPGQHLREWMRDAGMDFEVQLIPVKYDWPYPASEDTDTLTQPGSYVITRRDNGFPTGNALTRYEMVQCEDIAQIVNTIAELRSLKSMTARVTDGGKYVNVEMRLDIAHEIAGRKLEGDLEITSGHDGRHGLHINLRFNLEGLGILHGEQLFDGSIKHTSSAPQRIKKAREAAGKCVDLFEDFAQLAAKVASVPAPAGVAYEMARKLWPKDAEKVRNVRIADIEAAQASLDPQSAPTLWGTYLAVTRYIEATTRVRAADPAAGAFWSKVEGVIAEKRTRAWRAIVALSERTDLPVPVAAEAVQPAVALQATNAVAPPAQSVPAQPAPSQPAAAAAQGAPVPAPRPPAQRSRPVPAPAPAFQPTMGR